MNLNFILQSLAQNSFIRNTQRSLINSQGNVVPAAVDVQNRSEAIRTRHSLIQLVENIEKVSKLLGIDDGRGAAGIPIAISEPSLGLNLLASAATYRSFEEINTTPTSFSPFGPAWSGSSNALLTIGGVYDGSNGSGNLSFEVRRPGVHGIDNLRIRVRDPQNNIISNFNIRSNHAIDRQYDLQNGLYFTLGAGSLINSETTSVAISDSVGSAVDPDLAFNGVRNNNPNFEFGGPAITDGSFDLNGQTINVAASDTLNDVVDRISQSAAGVTAIFNPISEQIEFTQSSDGSVPSIVLENDTSNFLVATKLDTGILTPGSDPEADTALQDVARFSSVQAGNLTINGVDIAIDPATDSLNDVVDAINASNVLVRAQFDTETQRFSLTGSDGQDTLILGENTTNFLASVNIEAGEIRAANRTGTISLSRSKEIAETMEKIFGTLNGLYNDRDFASGVASTTEVRGQLDAVIRSIFGAGSSQTEPLFGMSFDHADLSKRFGYYASLDETAFSRSLREEGSGATKFLQGTEDEAGFIARLENAASGAISRLNSLVGSTGSLVSQFV